MRYLILTSLFYFQIAFAQQTKYSIIGTVLDNSNFPVEFGNVSLFKKNNEVVSYTVIEKGKFFFENIKPGNYILKINASHFESLCKEISLNKDASIDIRLIQKHNILDEIEIIGLKKLITNKNGNTIINVNKTILAQEPTTTKLLTKLPKIIVNESQSSVEVFGKRNTLIYINNQPVNFDAITTLQVDEIETIEIINNPSSKYEANADSIIKIVLKKKKNDGFSLTLKETASLKTYFNNYYSNYFSLKKGKIETKISLAYNILNVWEKNQADYQTNQNNINSDYVVEANTNRRQVVLNSGLCYQINENNYLSFNSNLRVQEEPFLIQTETNYGENGISEFIYTESSNLGNRVHTNANLNYENKIDESNSFFVAIQHIFYEQGIYNAIVNFNENETSTVQVNQVFDVNSYNFKGSFQKNFQQKHTLEVGTNLNVTKTLSVNNELEYNLNEKNLDFYSDFSSIISDKIKYNLGLRIENNIAVGNFTANSFTDIERNNVNLFPKFNIEFTKSKNNSFSFNYTKSIVRPNFRFMSAISAYLNPYLKFTGNLNLMNSISDETNFSYQHKKKTFSLKYITTQNPIFPYRFNFNGDTVSVLPLNLKNEKSLNFEIVLPLKYKFWSSNNTLSFWYTTTKDEKALSTIMKVKPYIYYYSNQQFAINKNTSANLNFWGISNKQTGAVNANPIFSLNTSFSKKVNNFNFTISLNDILNTFEIKENYNLNDLSLDSVFYTDIQEASLSIKYSFGKTYKSAYKNISIGNSSRIK